MAANESENLLSSLSSTISISNFSSAVSISNFSSTTTLSGLNVTSTSFGDFNSSKASVGLNDEHENSSIFFEEPTAFHSDFNVSSSTPFPGLISSLAYDDPSTLESETSSHVSDFFPATTLEYYGENEVDVQPASSVGIAVGLGIGGFILLLLIVALVIFLARKRHILRKKESVVRVENPQYATERNATLPKNFDLTTHTAGQKGRNPAHNNSSDDSEKSNGKRKKDAPRPPIYRPNVSKDMGSKRKAPSPPRLMAYSDLYEKDSPAGSSEALELSSFYTAENRNADPIDDSSHSQPLLESFKPDKKSPKRNSKMDPGDASVLDSTERIDGDRDVGKNEDEHLRTALLGKKKTVSQASLDSYDKTKNPFYDA